MPITLASLNNGHSFDLRACCASVRTSSRPNLVPTRPLRPRNAAWWPSFVAKLNSTALGRATTVGVEAYIVVGHCRLATMTLAHNFIWPCNNSMLSCCTSSLSVSPSFASKPVKRRLNLRSSYLGVLASVSTTWLTTWACSWPSLWSI